MVARDPASYVGLEQSTGEPVEQEQTMTKSTQKRGFLRSAMDGFIAAREREANQYVARAMSMMDDKPLKWHGYSRNDLK